MVIQFYKYQGAGNDFILIDDRLRTFPAHITLIRNLCNRKFGIGSDGLILLQNYIGDDFSFDFQMVYYNPDGTTGMMCGNGARCIIAFAKHIGISREKFNFYLVSNGPYKAFTKGNLISLKMIDVHNISAKDESCYFLNTGTNHFVKFVENIGEPDDPVKKEEVLKVGREIRYREDEDFIIIDPNDETVKFGTNVNFVQVDLKVNNSLKIRTYEKGVENETLACGTGIVASAIAYVSQMIEKKTPSHYNIKVKAFGGDLEVDFDYTEYNNYTNVWLTGPAEIVFNGEIDTSLFDF